LIVTAKYEQMYSYNPDVNKLTKTN